MRLYAAIGSIVAFVFVGCMPATVPGNDHTSAGEAVARKAPTHLTIGSIDTDKTASVSLNGAGGTGAGSGGGTAEALMNRGLTELDGNGVRQPVLAVETPSIENGLWRVAPSGQMEVTWKLRDAQWHDGGRFTADDVLMTWKVEQDKQLAYWRTAATDYVSGVEAIDARTVLVRFDQIYLNADAMFLILLPNHLLADAYQNNLDGFYNLPYWTQDFVGIGPYKLKEWQPDIQVTFTAYDNYVAGRPKVDEITLKFIADPGTLMANLLAGGIDLVPTRGISVDQSLDLAKNWSDGNVGYWIQNIEIVFPQHLNPAEPAIADARFRRALYQALDVPEINHLLTASITPVADNALITLKEPEHRAIESVAVNYPYDLRAATQILDDMGFKKGTDGRYRSPDGRPTSVDIQATLGDINEVGQSVLADYWRKLGLDVTQTPIPRARTSDNEFRYGRPGFSLAGGGAGTAFVNELHSKQRPLPETRWVGRNRSRYSNPEVDAQIERFQQTLAFEPRMAILRQIVRTVSEDLALMPLSYTSRVSAWNKRIQGVDPNIPPSARLWWNVGAWTAGN